MFFDFRQNPESGTIVHDDSVRHLVIIEAHSAAHANKRGLELGMYFDGLERGLDCECCGDRWYRAQARSGYETDPTELHPFPEATKQANIIVHYLDGRIAELWFPSTWIY